MRALDGGDCRWSAFGVAWPVTLTFKDAETTLCSGRYVAADANAASDGGRSPMAHDHHEAGSAFRLVEARAGDCSNYTVVTFDSRPDAATDAQGAVTHFHLHAGRPRPDPWGPAVVTPVEDGRFTEAMLRNLAAFVEGLPPR
jgi:hypothetical protein